MKITEDVREYAAQQGIISSPVRKPKRRNSQTKAQRFT
jgi:hypothetical protein